MKRSLLLLASILTIIVALSFTDFYGVAYILVALVSAASFKQFFIFRTTLQKFILSSLILLATIPLVGLICWLLDTELLPVYNIAVFILITTALYTKLGKKDKDHRAKLFTIDKADIVAVFVALAPITIIFVSYTTAPNLSASLFQLASEGWDNGSHILMLEDNSSQKGYVYGPYDELKNKIIQNSNAYPQAWHLATADIVNGFGGNRFIPEKPISTILAYMIAAVAWMATASYLFVLCAWRFYEHATKKKVHKLIEIIPLVSVALLVIMVVFTSSLMHGFINYIGSLVYLMLLSAMVIEARHSTSRRAYMLAILFGTMSVLTWFLTLPAVGLIILLMILTRFNTIKDSLIKTIRDWRLVLFAAIGGAAMIFQLYIFQIYSTITGQSQLNVGSLVSPFDVTGSPFHISHVLFGLIIAVFLVYLLLNKVKPEIKRTLLILVVPWLLLVFGVYLYQNITVGQNSYYLTKVMGLCLTATALPVGALLCIHLSKAKTAYPKVTIPLISIFTIGLVVLGSGQPTYGLNKLFQANARTTYGTAAQITPLLSKTVEGKAYIVVLTGRKSYENSREDNHGKLEIRVVHQELNCTYAVTGYISIKTAVKRLAKCADQPYMKNKTIYALTSPASYSKVKDLDRANIVVIRT